MGRQEDLDAAYAELERRKNPEPCGLCHGAGVNNNSRLWPGRIACRACKGSGVEEPYTVAGPGGERVIVTMEDIKAIMDKKLHVGQISSRQGDGSRPYAVFSKRECAAEIAEMVNRRFNSRAGEK